MKTSQTHYPSFFGAFLFAAAGLLLFAVAFLLGMSALFTYLGEGIVSAQIAVRAATITFLGFLVGGAAVVALLKFLNKPAADAAVSTSFPTWQIVVGALGAGLSLLLGHLIRNNETVNWLALPILTLPAVLLPI